MNDTVCESRTLLYLAAPYTLHDPVWNTHRVVKVASAVYAAGEMVPVVPHLSLLWHLVDPRPVDFWYGYDLHLLRACTHVVRLPGPSVGADDEIREAVACGLTVVRYRDLPVAAHEAWGRP